MGKGTIRTARAGEIGEILSIYAQAREFMEQNGNPSQWGKSGYPERELLLYDIELERLFVLERDGNTEAVFVLAEGDEPTYAEIEDGAWKNDKPYLTIHRLASRTASHGCAEEVLEYCKKAAVENGKDLRADTHEDNAPMLHILKKNGFCYCGIISVRSGSKRRAYQMIT